MGQRTQATADGGEIDDGIQFAVVFLNQPGKADVGIKTAAPQIERDKGMVALQTVIQRFQRQRVEVEQEQVMPRRIEGTGDGATNTAAGAGEQDGLHGVSPNSSGARAAGLSTKAMGQSSSARSARLV